MLRGKTHAGDAAEEQKTVDEVPKTSGWHVVSFLHF
jgi:hypothetical protein